MRVWLDDERPEPEGWVRCRTPSEVIRLIESGNVSELSLDHDLALISDGGEETGYDVLLWLEARVVQGVAPPAVLHVHSANPVARRRMEQAISAIRRLADAATLQLEAPLRPWERPRRGEQLTIVVNHLRRQWNLIPDEVESYDLVPYAGCAGFRVDPPHPSVRLVNWGEPVRLSQTALASHGGALELGAVVSVSEAKRYPGSQYTPFIEPYAEDYTYEAMERLGRWDSHRFWEVCSTLAVGTLDEIVGVPVQLDAPGVYLRTRTGTGSLGIIAPPPPHLTVNDRGHVVCEFLDPRLGRIALPVHDLRFFDPGNLRAAEGRVVDEVNNRIHAGVEVLIGIDVDLPYLSPENPKQWLQVSAIHLRDDPYWPGAQPGQPHALSVTWHGRPATHSVLR